MFREHCILRHDTVSVVIRTHLQGNAMWMKSFTLNFLPASRFVFLKGFCFISLLIDQSHSGLLKDKYVTVYVGAILVYI